MAATTIVAITAVSVVGSVGSIPNSSDVISLVQRPKDYAVHNREDGGVGANAEGERQQCHGGEAGSTPKRAQPVTHVAHEILEPRQASLVAHRLQRLRHTAGSDPHAAYGFSWRRASALYLVGRELEMRA